MQSTSLKLHFYEHLAAIADLGQVFVIENEDPPTAIRGRANIEMFAGEKGPSRQGLFPALPVN